MFFVSNYVVVSVISFIIFTIWTLNNILFLEGTRGFRASLTVIFYIFAKYPFSENTYKMPVTGK